MRALKKKQVSKRGFIKGYDVRARRLRRMSPKQVIRRGFIGGYGRRAESLLRVSPLVERRIRLEKYYIKNGLNRESLTETEGYRKLNEVARDAGLGGITLNYEIISPFPYSPVRVIPIKQRVVIRTTPEMVLTVDSLLKVFPELIERAWAYETRHEAEHVRGHAFTITEKMNELWREGMSALGEFRRLMTGFEVMADVQCFVNNGKDVNMFIENVPMFTVLFNSIHHGMGWVVDESRFSEEQRNADRASLNIRYPFLKKGIVERMLDNINKARAELKRRVGGRDLRPFSIAAEARKRAKALQEFAVKKVY